VGAIRFSARHTCWSPHITIIWDSAALSRWRQTLKARFITLPTYQVLLDWRDSSLNTAIEMYMNGGTVDMSHGQVNGRSSTSFAVGVTYDLWIEWTKGTAANGTLKLFISSNGTKPAVPEVNIANGNGGVANRFTLGPESSGNVIFDQILVDDIPIGSNPGNAANQPPTISDITNQITPLSAAVGPIPFTIGDAQVAAANLQSRGSIRSIKPEINWRRATVSGMLAC